MPGSRKVRSSALPIRISAKASPRSSCARRASQITGAEILGAIAGRVAKYKQPKQVIFVDELPRNTMGKVQKNLLRETYKDLYAS